MRKLVGMFLFIGLLGLFGGVSFALNPEDFDIDSVLYSNFYKQDNNLYNELKDYVVKVMEEKEDNKIDWKEFKTKLKTKAFMLKETYPSIWDNQYDMIVKQFDDPYWTYRKYELGKYIVDNTDFRINPDANVKIIDSLVTKFLLKLTKISDSQRKAKIEKICSKLERILPTIKDEKTKDYVKYLEYELLTQHTPYVKILKNGFYAYFVNRDFDKDGQYRGCWEKGLPDADRKCMPIFHYRGRIQFIYSPWDYTKRYLISDICLLDGNSFECKKNIDSMIKSYDRNPNYYTNIQSYLDSLNLGGITKLFPSLIDDSYRQDNGLKFFGLISGRNSFYDYFKRYLDSNYGLKKLGLFAYGDSFRKDTSVKYLLLWPSTRFVDVWGIWYLYRGCCNNYRDPENYRAWPIK